MSRIYTNKLLELVDDGVLDAKHVLLCCLKYMSEDAVRDMTHHNELVLDNDEETEEN